MVKKKTEADKVCHGIACKATIQYMLLPFTLLWSVMNVSLPFDQTDLLNQVHTIPESTVPHHKPRNILIEC